MADLEEDGVDLETLQAQIDMSMAFTQNIVSSWMKSSKVKLSSSSKANDEKELEDLLRRPQRLGVGASVPDSAGVLSRETAKLRNKLVGSGKKRAREDDSTPAVQPIVISDDEEDSRARVITKKARIDPFAPKAKDKKKGKAIAPPTPVTTAPSAPAATSASAGAIRTAPKPAVPDRPRDTPRAADVMEDSAKSPVPSKRKKKKKHKAHGDEAGPEHASRLAISVTDRPPAASRSGSGTRQTIVIAVTPPPENPLLSTAAKASPSKTAPASQGRARPDSSAPSAGLPPSSTPQFSPQRLDPFGLPLLNLAGPPPDTIGEQPSSPKKKQRKKKKKKRKKGIEEVPANAELIDVDALDDGIE